MRLVDDTPWVGLPWLIAFVLKREPMRSPFVLAVTVDMLLAADVRWPGPVVAVLREWEYDDVILDLSESERGLVMITAPGQRKPWRLATQHGGQRWSALLTALAELPPRKDA